MKNSEFLADEVESSKVYRVSIANCSPDMLIEVLATSGFSGTVFEHTGFWAGREGQDYGVEKGATAECAVKYWDEGDFLYTVQLYLFRISEECAYITRDGRKAALLYALNDSQGRNLDYV